MGKIAEVFFFTAPDGLLGSMAMVRWFQMCSVHYWLDAGQFGTF